MAEPKSFRRAHSAVLLALALLPACGSSGYVCVVQVNPPEATVYLNGIKLNADRRPVEFNFGQNERIYLQATHRDYKPHFEWLTPVDLKRIIDRDLPVRISLTSR